MLKSVLAVGLLAGLAAGLATAALQHVTTVPLIVAAEVYEAGTPAGGHHHDDGHDDAQAASAHDGATGHAHGGDAWAPSSDLERTVSTAGATVVSGVGLSLVLIALMLLAGERITPTTALAWSAAGFAATGLATGLGLAPELPGSAAANLIDRQAWWAGTALATGLGLYALLKVRTPIAIVVGLVLVAAPHVIGAPHPDGFVSSAPAELAARFASASLVVHAAFWALVGLAVGTFWQRWAAA
jgi:cobalt transporter subunit CbtA